MTWTATWVIWSAMGACGFVLGRRVWAHGDRQGRDRTASASPAWLERHQRLHTHASLAAKRQTIDGSRQVVRKETLKLHLSPHFMFNALSSVQWLWGEGRIDEAKRVFPTFVDLWKSQWREEGAQANPLKEELATLEQDVRLEEVRLGCNVAWTICCPKEEWLNTLIPSLLLQPAIENAIWHGFNVRAGNHAIEIEVMRSQVKSSSSWLDIVVRDNGAGLSDVQGSSRKPVVSQGSTHHLASDRRPSVGLTVTRNRLIEHHPDACFLLRKAEPPWSTEAIFSIPTSSLGRKRGQAPELGQPR